MGTSKRVVTPVNGVVVQLMSVSFLEAVLLHGFKVDGALKWVNRLWGAEFHMFHVSVHPASIFRNNREAMEFSAYISVAV